jgi:hypothetical protein
MSTQLQLSSFWWPVAKWAQPEIKIAPVIIVSIW